VLDQAPELVGVVRAGVWFNNIDIRAAGEMGIVVCNVPDYGTEEVADHALGLLLALARRIVPAADSIRLLAAGEIDGYLGNPPVTQELRANKIGRVVVNSTLDRPWSQYFCCLVAGNREFVLKHPVATKRALRAILKADQICALEPERVARAIVDRGFTKSYEYALQTMKEVPYGKWREYDPEDTIRFFALRLHEAGMIKTSPQKIISQGTDWRFLKELKKELKA